MATVADVNTEARGYLDDLAAEVYTDAILLPFIKRAYSDLQREFQDKGLDLVRNQASSVIDVPPNTFVLPNQPADIIYPISLQERQDGGTFDDWVDMTERKWETDDKPTNLPQTLDFWAWRSNFVLLRGASSPREVALRYVSLIAQVVNNGSVIGIIDSENYLACRAAAIAAESVGQNTDKAAIIQADASYIASKLIAIGVKKMQSMPVRQKPFRRRR